MWEKNFNCDLMEEDVRMTNKHMKRCLKSLFVSEMQIITTLRLSVHIHCNQYDTKDE